VAQFFEVVVVVVVFLCWSLKIFVDECGKSLVCSDLLQAVRG
jgi:hypothetical protein